MSKKGMVIHTDVSDWHDEYMQAEPNVSSEDAAVQTHVAEKFHPLQMGRLLIVGRERGDSPDDILPPNKLLLNTGAAYAWSQKLCQRRKAVEIPGTEKTVSVREIVGGVRDEDGENPDSGLVMWNDADAVARAEQYLSRVVTGHIFERLKSIAVNGGDVQAAVDELKRRIDDMVERLV